MCFFALQRQQVARGVRSPIRSIGEACLRSAQKGYPGWSWDTERYRSPEPICTCVLVIKRAPSSRAKVAEASGAVPALLHHVRDHTSNI